MTAHPFVTDEAKRHIANIKQLRHDIPEFKKNDVEVKDQINAFHNTITELVIKVQFEMGFATFGDALYFIDSELKRNGEAYAA